MPNQFLVKDAKYLLLTYPRIPRASEDALCVQIVHTLSEIGAECLVCRELHEPTGAAEDVFAPAHFHVFVDFGGRKFSTRDPRRFDVGGLHPNIERVGRTPWIVFDYATKDGDVVGGGATRPEEDAPCDGTAIWEYMLAAGDKHEFLARMREYQPMHYIRSHTQVLATARTEYPDPPEEYEAPRGVSVHFEGYPEIKRWVDLELNGDGNRYVNYKYLMVCTTPPSRARPLPLFGAPCLGITSVRVGVLG